MNKVTLTLIIKKHCKNSLFLFAFYKIKLLIKCTSLLFLLFLLPVKIYATNDNSVKEHSNNSGYSRLQLDNDMFDGTDKNYTGGFEFEYKPKDLPIHVNIGLKVYTPEDKSVLTPPAGEHPYVGYRYIGVGHNFKSKYLINNLSGYYAQTGPQTHSGKIQDIIHDAIGSTKFNGWNSQVSNSSGVQLSYKGYLDLRQLELGGRFKIYPFVSFNKGKFFDNNSIGVKARVGLLGNTPKLEAYRSKSSGLSIFLDAGYEDINVDKNLILQGTRASDYSVEILDNFKKYSLDFVFKFNSFELALGLHDMGQQFKTESKNKERFSSLLDDVYNGYKSLTFAWYF